MPLTFICSGIIILLFNWDKKIFNIRSLVLFISLICLQVGFFIGDVSFNYFSLNIFHLLSILLLVFYFSFFVKVSKNILIVLALLFVCFLILQHNESLLLFYSNYLYKSIMLLALILTLGNFYKVMFASSFLSVGILFIDLYYELQYFDYYYVSFLDVFNSLLVSAISCVFIKFIKDKINLYMGVKYEKVGFFNFNNCSNFSLCKYN